MRCKHQELIQLAPSCTAPGSPKHDSHQLYRQRIDKCRAACVQLLQCHDQLHQAGNRWHSASQPVKLIIALQQLHASRPAFISMRYISPSKGASTQTRHRMHRMCAAAGCSAFHAEHRSMLSTDSTTQRCAVSTTTKQFAPSCTAPGGQKHGTHQLYRQRIDKCRAACVRLLQCHDQLHQAGNHRHSGCQPVKLIIALQQLHASRPASAMRWISPSKCALTQTTQHTLTRTEQVTLPNHIVPHLQAGIGNGYQHLHYAISTYKVSAAGHTTHLECSWLSRSL
jgi:hypothetical protein